MPTLIWLLTSALVAVTDWTLVSCGGGEVEPPEPNMPVGVVIEAEVTGQSYANPVVGETLIATSSTWYRTEIYDEDGVFHINYTPTNEYGTPTYKWYRYDSRNNKKTAIGTNSNTYTVTSSDIGYCIDLQIKYSGYINEFEHLTNVVVGTPITAQAFLSLDTYIENENLQFYYVVVRLTLSDGTWVKGIESSIFKSWFTISGSPNVNNNNSWFSIWHGSGGWQKPYEKWGQVLTLVFISTNGTYPSSNITVTFNSNKVAEIKNYTNVSGTLFVSPYTVSSSTWDQR